MKNIKSLIVLFAITISMSAFGQSKETHLCGAETKKGLPCRNKVTESGAKCWMHGGASKTDVRIIAVQCSATAKSSGQQCRNKTTNTNGLCHVHNK